MHPKLTSNMRCDPLCTTEIIRIMRCNHVMKSGIVFCGIALLKQSLTEKLKVQYKTLIINQLFIKAYAVVRACDSAISPQISSVIGTMSNILPSNSAFTKCSAINPALHHLANVSPAHFLLHPMPADQVHIPVDKRFGSPKAVDWGRRFLFAAAQQQKKYGLSGVI